MMPLGIGKKKEPSARAQRVRLDLNGQPPGPLPSRQVILAGVLLVIAFLVLLELVFPGATPVKSHDLTVGQIAREDIVAPFDFDVLKSEEELDEERRAAEAGVLPVYEYRDGIRTEQRKHFGEFLTKIYEIRTGEEPESQRFDMLGQLSIPLSEDTRRVLLDEEKAADVEERAREVLNDVYDAGIVRSSDAADLSPGQTVMLVRDGEETLVRQAAFLREGDIPELAEGEAMRALDDPEMAAAVRELVVPFLRWNVAENEQETERRRREAIESVSRQTGRDLKENEVIIERGERVTEDHLVVLQSMEARRAELLRMERTGRRFFPALGRALQALLLIGALALYVAVRKRSMLLDLRCQILFIVLLVIVMAGAAVIHSVPELSPYLIPVAVLAMLASMLFGFEIAIIATTVTVMLSAIYAGLGIPYVFVSLVAGSVAAYSVRRVRHREDFYWSGIRVVAAYAIAIAVADIARVDLSLETLTRCGWGGLNAIVSMGIVVVALPLFERGFKVTTDITLLELADMNKPLLRKMAMAAPGSYHHSIIVGNLSEAAAEAIRANGLLARVGAYYHDIGKLVTPGYFVENQQGIEPEDSKHTSIRPKVSSLVIRSHVKDGEELARKEGLPEPIIDIIREHHGTSRMEFFYQKAVEEAGGEGQVPAADFSYPGPRPRSKESAIISLADTIEARVRSIDEQLTPKRIEAEIDAVIEKRWHDHQLDDAELTLSDLRKIRDAFFRVLVGMYHQRVRYPDQEENGEGREDGPEETRKSGGGTGRGDADQG
ncbi:MAG: HDIG domain-containing protein [Candidatus Eisenbacteria bacterium]|nr:HDIG domain-containing protein [Candidatus Eisenbacteria bacterium]